MIKKIIKLFICVYIVYCLIYYSEKIGCSLKNALDIWLKIIIPSVFPYLVLARYVCDSDIMDIFEVFPGKWISGIFKLSACSIKPFICSLFCGYPAGAICAGNLYEKGLIKVEEAKRLICFTNNAGPLFLISAIGGGMLGSMQKGFAIYIIQLASALCYGYICSAGKKRNNGYCIKNSKCSPDLCTAVKESVVTAVNICGFMTAASVLAECCRIFADVILPDRIKTECVNCFINGFFEISAGVGSVASKNCSSFDFGMICGFVSWSGVSVILQIKSVAKNIISTGAVIKAKLCQAVMSFFAGYAFDKLLVLNRHSTSKGDIMIKLSLIVSVVLFVYYVFQKKKLSD